MVVDLVLVIVVVLAPQELRESDLLAAVRRPVPEEMHLLRDPKLEAELTEAAYQLLTPRFNRLPPSRGRPEFCQTLKQHGLRLGPLCRALESLKTPVPRAVPSREVVAADAGGSLLQLFPHLKMLAVLCMARVRRSGSICFITERTRERYQIWTP